MRREILMNENKYSEAHLLEETVQNPKIYKLKYLKLCLELRS